MLSKKAMVVLLVIAVIVIIGVFVFPRNSQSFNLDFQSKSIVKNGVANAVSLNIFGNTVLNPFR